MPRIKVNMTEVVKASLQMGNAENAVKGVADDIRYARCRVDGRIAERHGIGSRLNQITNTISQIESDMENIENTINRGASRYSDTENNIVASGREIKNRIRAQIFTAEAAAGALGISKEVLKMTGIDKMLEKIWDGSQESEKTAPVSDNEKITDVKSNNESVWSQGTDLVGSVAIGENNSNCIQDNGKTLYKNGDYYQQIVADKSKVWGYNYDWGCTWHTAKKLSLLGIASIPGLGNGRTWVERCPEREAEDGKYGIKKYNGETWYEELMKEYNNGPVYNVMLSFETNPTKGLEYCGHVMLIDAIIDGVVYYTDTYPVGAQRKTIKEFISFYQKYNGNTVGAVHFYK